MEEQPQQSQQPAPQEQPQRFQTQEEQFQESRGQKLKRFIKEVWRVLRITKKPSKEEFKTVVKVTSIGAAIVGALGFVIFMIKQFLV